ncbi:uncharacterized protein LOC111698169 [Eurytemora carolleeae]|uniref:uncharacterized protein LOC111698169 n=1 Tax=Eurytemora carolleeae TaxID=1294199 RepID=UPI000C76647E|nr:uncharacterized protein LOC111698169 [Eurytemora carolleeae]|eukprot:XP_023324194.1 uncharacterized protein LOC111698169 [Eurytemora affinis]
MQRVRYIPSLDDNNRTISCMVMQSLEGITHYTRTLSYRLQVEKRPVSPGGPLIQGISVVSGVLILFILALLACSLLVALLVKQKGRKKKRNKIIRAREEENSLFDEDHDLFKKLTI